MHIHYYFATQNVFVLTVPSNQNILSFIHANITIPQQLDTSFCFCCVLHSTALKAHNIAFQTKVTKKVSQTEEKSFIPTIQPGNLHLTRGYRRSEVPFHFVFRLVPDLKFPGHLHRHDSSKPRRLSKLNNIRRRNHRTCKQYPKASFQAPFLIGSHIVTNLRTGMLSFRKLMLFPFPFHSFFS